MDIQKLIETILNSANAQKIKQDIQLVQQVLRKKLSNQEGQDLKVYVLLLSPKISYISIALTVAKSQYMGIAKNAICKHQNHVVTYHYSIG